MAIEERPDDLRLLADEFSLVGLQRQRQRGAGHPISGQPRLHDHWSQDLESPEAGGRGLRTSPLILVTDALVLGRLRKLHLPQRAQVMSPGAPRFGSTVPSRSARYRMSDAPPCVGTAPSARAQMASLR